ncbi:MAG: DUF2281 domain-containing protein [Chlorobium sp.]|nr:MAG: DUF2281 domain-containing protein [Chlorobium sp.]
MTTAEQIYKVVKELPEPMRQEVLDFVEFLKQKTIPDDPQSGNLAIRIHHRFKGLDADNLPIPPRQLSRNTDDYFDNPKIMEAIERGRGRASDNNH